ncbi:UNVERIFIED_CONTAM: thiamine phosphate synthase [Prevotella sp. 15_C9]
MKIIVITPPTFLSEEADIIQRLLDWGVASVHIRKPQSSVEATDALLSSIPTAYHSQLVLHDHFNLTARYTLQGIHLNRRNPVMPSFFHGTLSCSCHSLQEIKARKPHCDYLFLSPVFDSISKKGYRSAFRQETLAQAAADAVIDSKVFALGGIKKEKLPTLRTLHFGGAVFLGDVWQRIHADDFKSYILDCVNTRATPSE